MRTGSGLSARSLGEATVAVSVGGLALATALALAGGLGWPLGLAEHFQLHYLVLALPCLIAALALALVRTADVAGLVALVNLIAVTPSGTAPRHHAPAGATRLRLLAANVLTANANHADLARLIATERPDVLVLVEVDAPWLAALAEATAGFATRLAVPRGDNFGIAVYARAPLARHAIHDLGGVPAIVATLDAPGGLTVIAAHVIPPVSRAAARDQLRQLDRVADLTRAVAGPRIVVGDLNATPWSRPFARLQARTGLRDSRLGFGVQATFPAGLGWAGLPIDHALVSADVAVTDRRVGPPIGSDHRPIVVDLAVPSARPVTPGE